MTHVDQQLRCDDIEIAVAYHFSPRMNVIVPNVSWGLRGLGYEADMVVLRPSGYAAEIEIKVSLADIRADLRKKHRHECHLFSETWFAVPEALASSQHIPEYAGVIAVLRNDFTKRLWCRVVRRAKRRSKYRWEPSDREALMRLGCMRIWSLKGHRR